MIRNIYYHLMFVIIQAMSEMYVHCRLRSLCFMSRFRNKPNKISSFKEEFSATVVDHLSVSRDK